VYADFPALVSDNFAASPRYGRLYVAYKEFSGTTGVKVSHSSDGGVTWGPSGGVSLATAGQGANLVVHPDGALSVFYFVQGTPSSIAVRRSTDSGSTFDSGTTITTLTTSGDNGDLGYAYRTNAFPRAAANPANGNLYVVYNDKNVDSGNVYFRHST